ncbi:MAG TPA: GNAT family protein [Herpetosiphonaceae bacterium]|nr:GNAT family protein [Herpetosiphonaceae bacterium]
MLVSQRLLLRLFTGSDAPALLALSLANCGFMRPWEPRRDDAGFTLAATEQSIQEQQRQWSEDLGYSFGVWDRTASTLIGRVTLSRVTRRAFQNCGVGYWLDMTHNGRGYMTEAVRLVVGYAFGELGFHRVEAATLLHNVGSIRVLEKTGFRREGLALRYLQINGRWQDHYLWAITSEEWPAAGTLPSEGRG